MKKICLCCGNEFNTKYATKVYCSERCKKRYKSFKVPDDYNFEPEFEEPLTEFDCANCGRHIKIYSRYDQRFKFCCSACASEFKRKRDRTANAKRREKLKCLKLAKAVESNLKQ